MPDSNINTIEEQGKTQVIEGNESPSTSPVTEMQSPLVETRIESTTPYPEVLSENELKPPTKEEFTLTTKPLVEEKISKDIDTFFIGYDIEGEIDENTSGNRGRKVQRDKKRKIEIPSNV